MAAVNKSNVTTVSARKMLKRLVVLMIGKRLCTVRYAGGGEGGLTDKTGAWGDLCSENYTDIEKKWLGRQKCLESFETLFLASSHVRALKLKGHFSGSCDDSHKSEYTARSWRD